MKYLIVTLLITLLGVTTARAVSTNWKSVNSTWKANGSFQTNFGATTDASFSVGVVFDVADLSTFTASSSILLGVRNSNAANNTGPSFEIWANGDVKGKADPQTAGTGYTITANGATYGVRGTADFNTLLKTGKNAVAITVDMFTNSSGLCTTYTLYVNGSKLVEGTHSNIGEGVYDYQNLATVSGAEVYYMNSIASQADINSLPEPTVLALLALGVAGVALRRKLA